MAPLYKLTYLPAKGLGETIRFLLSYGGADFDDVRMEKGPALKSFGPFGKVPVLEFEGHKLHQSMSICRFLAKKFGLVGEDEMDAVYTDIAVDTINDFANRSYSFLMLRWYGLDMKEFEAKKAVFLNEDVPFFLPKFEEQVKNNGGHFVNGKLTWADIHWTVVADSMKENLQGLDVTQGYPNLTALQAKVLAIPSIKAWVEKRPK